MSAFVVDNAHIDYLVSAAILWQRDNAIHFAGKRIESEDADDVGRRLLVENIHAVHCLYPHRHPSELPTSGYHHRMTLNINPLWVLQAIRCYEYQCCEDPFWDDTNEKAFCDELTEAAIGHLPGMDDAPWEITREHLSGAQAVRPT